MNVLQTVQLQEMLAHVVQIAVQAGSRILEVYAADFAVHYKQDDSPLTRADRRSHDHIVSRLDGLVTADGNCLPVLSEEGKDIPHGERKSWRHYWLVDPLDGTKEFIKRNGEFTVNIALIQRQKPVLGVVLIPALDLLYFCAQGVGAYKLDQAAAVFDRQGAPGQVKAAGIDELISSARRLPLPVQKKAETLVVAGSRSHRSRKFDDYVQSLKGQGKQVQIVSRGSSLKFCLVAEGTADLYPRFGPTMEWDTAAGQALCECVGKKVAGYATGKALVYNKESLVNPEFLVG